MGFNSVLGNPIETETDLLVTTMLNGVNVPAASSTTLAQCSALATERARAAGLALKVTFDGAATGDVVFHLRASYDGVNYDTIDLAPCRVPCNPGQTDQASIAARPEFFDLKVIAENEDAAQAATVTVIGQAKLTEEAA